jgi:hypothetical protein
MSQTLRQRRYSPVAMRWLRAGSDPTRSDHGHQYGESLLIHSEHAPRCLLPAPDLACDPIRRSHPACVASTIQVGAGIKSP